MKIEKIRRIAVLRNDRLGDLVCTLPVFEALRRHLPQAHVAAFVSPETAPLLKGHPDVDQIVLAEKRMPTGDLARLLREGQFDTVLMIRCPGRHALAALLSGARIRVAHGRQWFHALCGTHRFYKSRRHPPLHEAEYALSFTERLGVDFSLADARPRLIVDPAEQGAMRARIEAGVGTEGPLFGVHPGHRTSAYNWPRENYLAAIERLSDIGRVVITGSHYDAETLDWITNRLDPALRRRVMTLSDMTIPQLVAALSLVDAYLASSTGPLHIAAIVSGTAIGLFCDVPYQHPNRWQPIGKNAVILMAHCQAKEPPANGSPESEAVMAQISVEQVVERMAQAAKRSRAA